MSKPKDATTNHENVIQFAASWGWNSEGRAGNTTANEIRIPQQVQKSKNHNYISCAAGQHHSLLVTTEGNILSFGANRKDQLGYGNPFSSKPLKGVQTSLQAHPRNVNPSGSITFDHDIKVTEVSCGAAHSVAREQSPQEAINRVIGYKELLLAIKALIQLYPESAQVQLAHAQIRQELFNILKVAQGRVLMWGTGTNGQLGLGEYMLHSSYPQQICKFRGVAGSVVVLQVSSGADHVLAVDSEGRLYSWGQGIFGCFLCESLMSCSSFDLLCVLYLQAGMVSSVTAISRAAAHPKKLNSSTASS